MSKTIQQIRARRQRNSEVAATLRLVAKCNRIAQLEAHSVDEQLIERRAAAKLRKLNRRAERHQMVRERANELMTGGDVVMSRALANHRARVQYDMLKKEERADNGSEG